MNGSQIRNLTKYEAEVAFMEEHVTDFPVGSAGATVAAEQREKLGRVAELGAKQTSNSPRQNQAVKALAMEKLMSLMKRMNGAARALADEYPGIERLFKMPTRRHESEILAAAQAFYDGSQVYQPQFLELDLPASFRSDLLALIDEVRSAKSASGVARSARGGATGALVAVFRECRTLSRKLNVIVRNKYLDDAEKLHAWEVASHLESGFKRHVTPEPKPVPRAALPPVR